MDFVVFYAWQSDSPAKLNRNLIRTAAEEAVRRIANDSQVEESPRLDHDTEGISGMPAVAETIFAKIEKCDVFLADVTIVGATSQGSKLIPNPNVLIELGYAARALGWERIVSVMNTAYGIRDELPFDLRHRRWPIEYHLPEGGSVDLPVVRRDLSHKIEQAIRSARASIREAASLVRELYSLRTEKGSVLVGRVSLPKGSSLMLDITASGSSHLLAQAKVAVADDGYFESEPVSIGDRSIGGQYRVTVSAYFNAFCQPSEVLAEVGTEGGLLPPTALVPNDPEFPEHGRHLEVTRDVVILPLEKETAIIQSVQDATLVVSGKGHSAEPIGKVVEFHEQVWAESNPLAFKVIGWAARPGIGESWTVTLHCFNESKRALAEWEYSPQTKIVKYLDQLAKTLSWVPAE